MDWYRRRSARPLTGATAETRSADAEDAQRPGAGARFVRALLLAVLISLPLWAALLVFLHFLIGHL